jgi:hypothetical protein
MTDIETAKGARWSVLCADFHTIRTDANRHGARERWRRLAAATLAGAEPLADWWQLVEELERLNDEEEDFSGRTGLHERLEEAERQGAASFEDWWPTAAAKDDLYRCPGGLCDRRVVSESGLPPRCDLLGSTMAHAAEDGRPTA